MLDRLMLGNASICIDHLILLVLVALHVADLFRMSPQHLVLLFCLHLCSLHVSHLQAHLFHLKLHLSLNSFCVYEFTRHLLYCAA